MVFISRYSLSLSAISQRLTKPGIDFGLGFDSDTLKFATHMPARLCLTVKPLHLYERIDSLALFLPPFSQAWLVARRVFEAWAISLLANLAGSPLGGFTSDTDLMTE